MMFLLQLVRCIVKYILQQDLSIVKHLAGQSRQGAAALPGDIYILVDGKTVLIKAPTQ